MSMEMKGMEEISTWFNNLSRIEKNKVIKNSVYKGAQLMLKAQQDEVPSNGAKRHGLSVKKASLRNGSSKDGFAYEVGMLNRGGKEFSRMPSKDNFYRAMWFSYWGFITLKNWDTSKRKHRDRNYPSKVTKPIYVPPNPWIDKAFDKSVDEATDLIINGVIDSMTNIK